MKRTMIGVLATAASLAACSDDGTRPEGVSEALTVPAFAGASMIPAFPEARGFGATALQECRERPIAVRRVTNTNADGAGSLRAALVAQTDSTFDIVLFETGGRIHLGPRENLVITQADCLYIAGQTAPGGGITITGNQLHIRGPGATSVDNTAGSDVVVRYLTFRKHRSTQFNLDLAIVDHVSCAWSGSDGAGGSNCISIGTRPDAPGEFDAMPWEWTFSNSLVYEMHENHPTVCHTNGHRGTVYGNVLAGPGHRLCLMTTNRMASSGIEFIHNVGYNWLNYGLGGERDNRFDVYGNYFKRGPATPGGHRLFAFHDRDNCPIDVPCTVSIFARDNRTAENSFGPKQSIGSTFRGPQRQYVCHLTGNSLVCTQDGGLVDTSRVRRTPLAIEAAWPVARELFTDDRLEEVLERAGNSQGLACDGTWVERRDFLDADAIQNFRTGTGRSEAWDFTGTGIPGASPDPDSPPVVPTPDAGTPCQDTSADGMPDAWLKRWGYSHKSPPPADSATESGYLLIEHYLNNSNPFDRNPWAKLH